MSRGLLTRSRISFVSTPKTEGALYVTSDCSVVVSGRRGCGNAVWVSVSKWAREQNDD